MTACRGTAPTCDLERVANDISVLDGGGTLLATGVDTAKADRPGCLNMGEGHERHEVKLTPLVVTYESDSYKGLNVTSQTTYVVRDPQCAGELTIDDQPGCALTLRQNGTIQSVVCNTTTERVDLSFRRKPR